MWNVVRDSLTRFREPEVVRVHFNNWAVKPTLLEIRYVPIKTFRVIFPEEVGFLDGRKTDMSSEHVV